MENSSAKDTPDSRASFQKKSVRTLDDVVQGPLRIQPGSLYYYPPANLFKLGIRKSQKARGCCPKGLLILSAIQEINIPNKFREEILPFAWNKGKNS